MHRLERSKLLTALSSFPPGKKVGTEVRIRRPASINLRLSSTLSSITSNFARAPCEPLLHLLISPSNLHLTTVTMVKLTEVEDEHFSQEKPMPSKHNVLLTSDDEEEDDYTDTG